MIKYRFFAVMCQDSAPVPSGGRLRVTRAGVKGAESFDKPYVSIDQLDLTAIALEFLEFAEIAGNPLYYHDLGIEFLLLYKSEDDVFGLALPSEFVEKVSVWKPSISFAPAPDLTDLQS